MITYKSRSFCNFVFLISLIGFLVPRYTCLAQLPDSTEGSLRLTANFHYGFVIAHRPLLVPLQQEHVMGFDVQVSRPTYGKAPWHRVYLYPHIGLNYSFFKLGDQEHLGNGHVLFPFVLFPVNKNPNCQFNIRFGAGIGYADKTYSRLENYKNQALSTHLNAIFAVHGMLYTRVAKRTYLQASFGVTHFSNGNLGIPNLGINIATVSGGMSYYFGKKNKIDRTPYPLKFKRWRGSVMITGSVKRAYPPGGPNYLAFSLSALESIRVKKKSAFGIGLDVFYDNSIHTRLPQYDLPYTGWNDQVRIGMTGSYELIISDLSFLLQIGGYLYTKLKSDGSIYNRYAIRYVVAKNYFLCFNLKTHFAKADFFEFGGGVKF